MTKELMEESVMSDDYVDSSVNAVNKMLWVGVVNQGTYTDQSLTYIIMYAEDNIISAGASHRWI